MASKYSTPSLRIKRGGTFVFVGKSKDNGWTVRYHLPSGTAVKRINADIIQKANAKSEDAIRSALKREQVIDAADKF
ncbi:MAG: hypothetical protein WAV18_17670 [Roseiarcus sp.]